MKLGLKILLIFLIFSIILTLMFYFIELQRQNETFDLISSEHVKKISYMFEELEKQDTKMLSSTLEFAIQDRGLKEAYLKKDRETLYYHGNPLFQNLKNNYGITHFYFILPDGRVFLRLHNKEIYDDRVKRITFLKANETKKLATGLELGKTAFALRAIRPYYEDGNLIGYVELGEEIDHFLKILKGNTSNEFAIIVEKKYLNKDDWRSVREVAGIRDNWDDSEKYLIISSTTEVGISDKCFAEENLNLETEKNRFEQFQNNEMTFICGGFPITDAGGRHIGVVLSLIDMTDHIATEKKSNNTLIVLAFILFIVTLIVGIFITRSISKPLMELKKATENIGKGDMDRKIDVHSEDEIGELALSFQRMAEDLQRTTVSKEYVDNIIGSMDEMLIVTTPEGAIQRVNRAVCDLLQYTEEELVGQPIDKILDDETIQVSGNVLKKGSLSNQERIWKAKDGSIIPLFLSGSIMYNKEGNIQGIVYIARDITDLKKAEMMQVENDQLARASKTKSEFLANMSHELRTPLNSIIGFSELLKQNTNGELIEKHIHFVDNIHTSGKFLLNLINDILDLSKVEAGKLELVIEKMSVPRVIDETLSLIKEKAANHNLLLKKELDPSITVMEADQQRVKQVLFNMLSNAIKFSKPEGGTITITVKKEGEMARFSVSDNGIGIREEDMYKLFMTFEQLDSGITKKYGGSGLGLAISRRLVELHGGKIWVESSYGVGTTFYFAIPLVWKKTEKMD